MSEKVELRKHANTASFVETYRNDPNRIRAFHGVHILTERLPAWIDTKKYLFTKLDPNDLSGPWLAKVTITFASNFLAIIAEDSAGNLGGEDIVEYEELRSVLSGKDLPIYIKEPKGWDEDWVQFTFTPEESNSTRRNAF